MRGAAALLPVMLAGCTAGSPTNDQASIGRRTAELTATADEQVNATIEELGPVDLWQPPNGSGANVVTPPG